MTEFTIHQKKLARPFFESKSEKTDLQRLHWSLSLGYVKIGLNIDATFRRVTSLVLFPTLTALYYPGVV